MKYLKLVVALTLLVIVGARVLVSAQSTLGGGAAGINNSASPVHTFIQLLEGSAPPAISGSELLYADSTGHNLKFLPNGGSATNVVTAPGGTTGVGISGGGALATGSNSFAGKITGAAASSNVLTPGFTCPNAVVVALQDDTTAGGAKVTAANTTTATFSATAADTVEYIANCR